VLRQPLEPKQYLSIRYADRLAANDIVASVGTKGDSYDSSFAESLNGLYKSELIHRQGPWNGEDVEFATMTYLDCSTTDGSTERSPTAPATPPPRLTKPPTTVTPPRPPEPVTQ
jgi:transposase InsO family protein